MANVGLTIINYLKDAKLELGKVTWPTKKEALRYSVLVIIACIAVAAFFGILDLGLNLGLDELIKAIK